MTGYLHPSYAESLSEFGKPRFLPRSGGWILERPVPGFPYRDAMGCYPLFVCKDWSQLHDDLRETEKDIVCLALVTDPFGNYDVSLLQQCFDKVIAYKEHFVAELSRPIEQSLSKHHRRNGRKALRQLRVEKCEEPAQLISDWTSLYVDLTSRHGIKGIAAFSRKVFEIQLRVPGIVAFRAVHQKNTVGMILWYIHEDIGYYHLGAYTESGYDLGASFALFWNAFEYFADIGVRWVDLGGGPGVLSGNDDGLSRFKRGWSTGTRPAYFCGRILDREKYSEVVSTQSTFGEAYFPAYRSGEFR